MDSCYKATIECIPDEIIIKIGLYINITNLSLTCHHFNDVTFNNENFWYLKCLFEFGLIDIKPKLWKYLYRDYGLTFVCGNGERGQLTFNDTDNKSCLTQINHRSKSVACGGYQTVIIDQKDQALLLKYTHVLKLNRNPVKSIACGRDYIVTIDLDNNIHIYEDNSPMNLNINIKAKSVSCGDYHIIFIDLNNNVWVLGNDNDGQLGLGDNMNRTSFTQLIWNQYSKAEAISCGRYHSIILDNNQDIWVFGSNNSGQLGLGDRINRNIPCKVNLNIKVKQISCGAFHSLILDNNDNVWSFGYNACGQLGLNHLDNKLVATQILNLPKIKNIYTGHSHNILQDYNNNIWAFGQNKYGQLGLNDTKNRLYPILINKDVRVKTLSCGYYHTIIIVLCIS